jgi:hypothetical protein
MRMLAAKPWGSGYVRRAPIDRTRWRGHFGMLVGSVFVRQEAGNKRRCRCGHPYGAHLHYRHGTECSLCAACQCYRPARSALARIVEHISGRFWRHDASQ